MFRQIADALAYLRSKAIAHRDIKPDNCMLMEALTDVRTAPLNACHVKIFDFGFAKDFGHELHLNGCGENGSGHGGRRWRSSPMVGIGRLAHAAIRHSPLRLPSPSKKGPLTPAPAMTPLKESESATPKRTPPSETTNCTGSSPEAEPSAERHAPPSPPSPCSRPASFARRPPSADTASERKVLTPREPAEGPAWGLAVTAPSPCAVAPPSARIAATPVLVDAGHGGRALLSPDNSWKESSTTLVAVTPVGTRQYADPCLLASAIVGDFEAKCELQLADALQIDAYALGRMLRYMLTGLPPGVSMMDALNAQGCGCLAMLGVAKPRRRLCELSELSVPARELLTGLTKVKGAERLSVSGSLRHPWLSDEKPPAPAHSLAPHCL